MKQNNPRIGFPFSLFLALSISGAVEAQVIGHWEFNEKPPGNSADAAPGAILDSSGNNHHLTAAGDPLPVYVAGDDAYGSGAALSFSLTDDRVFLDETEIGPFDFGASDSFTVEALVRVAPGANSIGSIVSKDFGARLPSWWFRMQDTGNLRFLVSQQDGPEPSVNGTIPINDGEWHHVAAVRDGAGKKLRVYVDYVLAGEANDTTTDTHANNRNLIIGAFNSGTQQFAGDIDFVRISSGALPPAQFVQALTYITDLSPADGSSFLPSTTMVSFTVISPSIGVPVENIQVLLNGVDVSNQLQFSGNNSERQVTLAGLSANTVYHLAVAVTDLQGNPSSQTTSFDTFSDGIFFIEAEDYNFDGGQFIDNPELSSQPGPNNYLDRFGVQDVDHHEINVPATTLYRIGDATGTAVSGDTLRQHFLDAKATDPGVDDYVARDFVNGEWLNYTRTFPAATYHIYARAAKAGTAPISMLLDEVTSGSTTTSQTTSRLGVFHGPATGAAQTYAFIPLTDALGNQIALPLTGVKTLRATMDSGVVGMNANYFMFAPASGVVQVPYVSETSPAADAQNEAPDTQIEISVRNADTAINTGSVQLTLDGVDVTASSSITPMDEGAQISHVPALLSIGWHTVTLVFADTAATSITNEWQFFVADQVVRAHWNFNEKGPGETVSTEPGAILDDSGNERHGTANDSAMTYVAGSFNYGSTSALTFTPTPDRVVVPDPAGNFNFDASFTMEAVVRTTSTANNAAILAKNGATGGEGEYWWRVPGTAGGMQRVGLNDGSGGKFLAGTTKLNDGNWHHVAVVHDRDAGEIRLYADYTLDATLSSVFFEGVVGRTVDLHIGSFVNGGSEFNGDIDFIRLSSGALSPGEFVQTSVALTPIVTGLRPADGATHVSPTALISAGITDRDTQVLLDSLTLLIDGADVTAQSTRTSTGTGAMISYLPNPGLSDGLHTATVMFNDDGSPANSITNEWQFTVDGNLPVVALYRFDEKAPGNATDPDADAIRDSSGNSRHGAVNEAMSYVAGSPNHGGTSALMFTLGADRVAVPDPNGVFNFTPADSATFEVILRTVTIGQSGVGSLLAKQGTSPGEWWWRINATGVQSFLVHDGSGSRSVNGVRALNDGEWHHVAAVYDGVQQQLRIYVDYELDASAAAVFPSNETTIGNDKDLWIGAFQAGNRQFDGDMDMVRVTAAALDPSWFIPLGGLPTGLQIVNPIAGEDSLSFSFATETGKSYVVQSSEALGAGWVDVETVPGDGATSTVTYAIAGSQKFYRVEVR